MKKSLVVHDEEEESGNKKKKFEEEGYLVEILKRHFGHSEFRGTQLKAIQCVLSGRDCFCLMPTGGGKSMCYQVPALARPKSGIVLVVCPLIALMENQVMALKDKGIPAEFLSSTQPPRLREKIHEDLSSGKPSIRLLYVTPELIATSGFMSKLLKLYTRGLLTLIAIDEAHCISSLGHDFRSSYRNLSSLRKNLPQVPLLALTATAVPKVQKDVMESLCLHRPLVLQSSFNRPNIYYEVRFKDLLEDVYSDLSDQLKSSGDACSIVYCLERTACDNLSSHLIKNGISCAAYHAGSLHGLRSTVLNDWLSSRIQVVVATVAFGMGIDRKDVRTVCHFNTPKSMESFYQESGRAGRDQLPSRSLLYYGIDDRKKMQFILSNAENKKLRPSDSQGSLSKKSLEDFNQMVEYCESSSCRRKKILENFGEQVPSSLCRKSCDACKHPNVLVKHLEELACASSAHEKNARSSIFISSCSDTVAEDQFTEFWNRNDEKSASEEDISDSDDDAEFVRNLARSKSASKPGIDEKIKFLQKAEEDYYLTRTPLKQKTPDQKIVPEASREASKQRLLNALKRSEERLGNLKFDFSDAVTLLENECYKKYGKLGKTFYNSQVASTVRWLSNTSFTEITDRLGTRGKQDSNADHAHSSPTETSLSLSGEGQTCVEDDAERLCDKVDLLQTKGQGGLGTKLAVQDVKLPPIPSFSEFIKKEGSSSSASKRLSTSQRDVMKRKKL